MGLREMIGGWGNSFNDTINNFIADHNDSYKQYLEADRAQAQQQQDHPSFFKGFTDSNSSQVGGLFAMAGEIPGFNQTMTYLDYGRRAADTMLITAKHAGAVSNSQAQGADSVAWGELLNRDNWSKAWDSASYENASRVTGGNIIAAQAFGHNDRIEVADPFAAKDAQAIQQAANGTWYGKTSSTLVDLGTSFIAPPGTGIAVKGAKAARAAKQIDGVATAEAAAVRLRDAGVRLLLPYL